MIAITCQDQSEEPDVTPPHPPSPRGDAVDGARAIAPVLLGAAPFGLVAGVAGVVNGATVLQTSAFSLVSFAGAAQIAAMDLLGAGATPWVVLLTMVAINLRFVLYSAGIAPWLGEEPGHRRALGAYLITDHAYVVSTQRFAGHSPIAHPAAFYLGAAATFWAVWQIATIVGALAGSRLPTSVPLTFAAPLSFLALLVPQLHRRPAAAAALVGGGVAAVGHDAPAHLGTLLGCLAGVAAGTWATRGRRGAA